MPGQTGEGITTAFTVIGAGGAVLGPSGQALGEVAAIAPGENHAELGMTGTFEVPGN